MHVAALHDGEVAQERPLRVLGAEARARRPSLPTSSHSSGMVRSLFVAATRRPPGRSTRRICGVPVQVGHVVEHPRGQHAVEDPVRNGRSCTSPTTASTPRSRVSSTIRSDWSTATTARAELALRPARRARRWPGPTSSTRRGLTSRDRLEGDPRGFGPVASAGRRCGARRLVGVLARDDRGSFIADAFGVTKSPRTKDDSSLSPLYSPSSLTARRSAARANGVRAPCRPARS